MSRRKNGTNRAAVQLGINPYGWGNGRKRKGTWPYGMPDPMNNLDKYHTSIMGQKGGKVKHGNDEN